jgi:hypothetical protein
MKHLTLIVAMMLTCILAAAANVTLARTIDINFFTLSILFVVPVGAALVGALGTSGAFIAARYLQIRPTLIDAVFMAIVAAATMVLIYYLDYATMVLDDGRKVSDSVDFLTFVDFVLTKSHFRFNHTDLGEAGPMGYASAVIKFVGFLLGGWATFVFIKGLPTCEACSVYLNKLKTKKTPQLTREEAGTIVSKFRTTDLPALPDVMAWTPPERSLKKDKALVSFNLYACPHCKAESIVARVQALASGQWQDVPALASRRDLAPATSLRHWFA